MKRKLIIVITAVITLIFVAGCNNPFTATNKQKTEPGKEALTAKEVSLDTPQGWETYTSEKLGYRFSYPPAWKIVASAEAVNLFPPGFDENNSKTIVQVGPVYPELDKLSRDDKIKTIKESLKGGIGDTKTRNAVGVRMPPTEEGGNVLYYIYLMNDRYTIAFTLKEVLKERNYEYENIFQSILGSFEFI